MCGIAGYIHLRRGPIPERGVLERMTRALRHRGPDAEGYFYQGHVALGHRRLSIIDLSGGAQPMFSEDGSCVIVFNGEIYNFPEIRARLERAGSHRFQTRSDTEIILHDYEDKGVGCLEDLNGMFAFALWDSARERLLLARDRMGKKPLYWTVCDGQLVFASELKALILHPGVRREIDPESLAAYLAFEYVPSPRSIFRDIHKLDPGHYLLIDLREAESQAGRLRPLPYWDLRFRPRLYDFEEARRELLARLRAAVERRLISDVPLGVFLSGGIDSSSVVALMAEMKPCRDIKTFSIGFRERSFDESAHARRIVQHFGTDHREEILDPGRLLEILPAVADTLDEPLADPSMIPTFLLSEFTRRHVTVALGGDGGDELFAGYDPFVAHYPSRVVERLPRPIINGLRRAAGLLPVSTSNISLDFKIKQFLEGLDYPSEQRHFAWLGSFPPHRLPALLAPDLRSALNGFDPFEVIVAYGRRMDASHQLHRTIYLYCKLYLQDDILVKVDRASMANSLEVRAPFLDVSFVEFVNTLPPQWKLHGLTTKYILKKALDGLVPHDNIYRRKKGFGIPIAAWFKGPLRKELIRLFAPERLKRDGFFDPAAVQGLLDEHLSGRRDNRKQLWTLFIFQNWVDRFLRP